MKNSFFLGVPRCQSRVVHTHNIEQSTVNRLLGDPPTPIHSRSAARHIEWDQVSEDWEWRRGRGKEGARRREMRGKGGDGEGKVRGGGDEVDGRGER